ncbi:MAG TPA: thioredoxin domain-containing protein [Geminicoccaceae bacterium]|jgi:protein-disulfide isomerase|nr:thioredoxin domain-containing protein [Geminicoccaceae bacterium]
MEGRRDQRERLRSERQAAESGAAATLARKRRLQYLILAAFAAVAVIVALIVISQSGGDEGGTASSLSGEAQVNSELLGIPQNGQALGEANAPITITEFGDPQCPTCAAFAEQIAPQLIAAEVQTGNGKLVFEPYLIIGPDSEPAMTAALAAGEQGRFWNYLQLFYANQGAENSGYVTDDFLTSIAGAAGVPDIDTWNRSRDDSKWNAVLARGTNEAQTFGFNGTPSIVVAGPKGERALSGFTLGEIEAAIQQVG